MSLRTRGQDAAIVAKKR